MLGMPMRNWVLSFWPKLILPKKVYLKFQSHQIPFEREKRFFTENQDLQGSSIPYYYGQVYYQSKPAILISEAVGVPLKKTPLKEMAAALTSTRNGYDLWTKRNIIYGDSDPAHIFIQGEQAMFIDFDCSKFGEELQMIEELQLVEDTNMADYGELAKRLEKYKV
jgi:hypothetical protein